MQINLYATFRLIAGEKTLVLDTPAGMTVLEAVRKVVDSRPVLKTHWFDASGELHAHVHVFLNGSDVSTLPDGLNTPTHPNDVIDFFPPVAGGS